MSEIETSISDLKDLRNSLLNKSANLDSSLLSMDKYVIANLRKVIVNAIEKIASAYCKLLFPHIKSLDSMSGEDIEIFKELYNMYCLKPAIESRTYIYEQCKLVDSEFKNYRMPEFRIR